VLIANWLLDYLIALLGSVCFAPLALCLPGWLWLYDHAHYWKGNVWQKAQYVFHWFLIVLGLFFLGGGTYAVIIQIIAAYATGQIGSAFSCLDNSNTVG
jgi:hypothetical protein